MSEMSAGCETQQQLERNNRISLRSIFILAVIAGAYLLPTSAHALSLADYLNSATVTASSDQFEDDTSNNSDDVQVTPNAELIIVKQIINDNGGTATDIADFTITTSAGPLSFSSGGVADPLTSSTTFTSDTIYVVPGTYTLIETDKTAYKEGSWNCTGGGTLNNSDFDAGSLTLAFGEQVTCTIVNDDEGIDLVIAKKVDDNAPDIGDTITFTLEVNNIGPDAATNVTVSDIVPAGFAYTAASISGGDSNDDTDPTGAGLGWTILNIPADPLGTSPVILTFQAVVLTP